MFVVKQNELYHYGTPRHSGRYPYGSGDNPYQRTPNFSATVLELKKQGMNESEIAKALGILDKNGNGHIQGLRNRITIDKNQRDLDLIYQARELSEKGYTNTKIGEMMGRNESTVREWLDPARLDRALLLSNTENILKDNVANKKYLDVGTGIELQVGVKRTLLDAAVYDLEQQGYKTHMVPLQQVGTGKQTWTKVLTANDVDYQDVRKNIGKLQTIDDWTEDGGETYQRLQPVKSLSSDRVMIRYDEDGGTDRDGMIQIRRGVDDLSLGDKKYAQVRIAVDDKYFMKGMAVYTDDLPDGVDIIYNSNKSRAAGPEGTFKKYATDDPTNPFKTTIRQQTYIDADGNEQLSPINKVGYSSKTAAGEEGYWDSWHSGKALASQFLAKQNIDVIKEQLDSALTIQKSKFDDINLVNNTAVKQRLLDSFADDCDSKAVHLEGASLPRQSSKVLLSIPSLKENEVYTTAYKNGESLILVRFPHAGTFEIPKVTVNNRNAEGKSMLGSDSIDAIGIHPKTAEKLSGADFDGDSVIAIPYSKRLAVSESLQGLKDFNPKQYKYPKEITDDPSFKDNKSTIHKMTDREKGLEMGKVSNLITDMTLRGAKPDHVAQAVRHSMVVIDAQKHDLDYKASFRENNIAELKKIYQIKDNGKSGGASTLLSRSTAEQRIVATRPLRKGDPGYEDTVRRSDYSVEKSTGRKVVMPIDPKAPYVRKDGVVVTPTPRETKSTRMYETEDARTLLSTNPHPKEIVYADFANQLKSLGNQARKESANIKSTIYSPSAKAAYASEVESLNAKLSMAKRNAPLERRAQAVANANIKAKVEANPNMDPSTLRKIKGQELESARQKVGAGKQRIQITEKEWEAIQSGAISHQKLQDILNNSNIEDVQKLATPRSSSSIPSATASRVRSFLSRGYTLQEVADLLNLSPSTVSKINMN